MAVRTVPVLEVPSQFAASDSLDEAYRLGWNHGHGIACHNVPTLGAKLWVEDLGRVTVDAENIREVHQSACFEAEANSRSYSPFEFTAHEFNACGDGGFRIHYDQGDYSEELYDTREEAEEAARLEGWEGTDIEAVPSAEELWEAFEAGTTDAILADLATYTDDDYGIEEEAEEDNDPDATRFAGTPWDTWRRRAAELMGCEPRDVSNDPDAYPAFNSLVTPEQYAEGVH